MTTRLSNILDQYQAATPAPWCEARTLTADGTQAPTKEDKDIGGASATFADTYADIITIEDTSYIDMVAMADGSVGNLSDPLDILMALEGA